MAEIIDLDYCWVCQKKFGPDLNKHMHHIIPRAYGGVDGPQVSLCSPHHTALHLIAGRLYLDKPFTEALTGDKAQDKKLTYLGSRANNARLLVENDPNKQQQVVVNCSKEFKDKLQKLKGVTGKKSMEAVIEFAVLSLYNKYFMD